MPRTMAEWAAYIAALDAGALARKARAVNAIDVVERLLEDGLTPDEVETVYVLFAQRMRALGVRAPDGGLYDWRELATRTPPVQVEPAAAASGDDDELADFLRD